MTHPVLRSHATSGVASSSSGYGTRKETEDEALARRLRESKETEDRSVHVSNVAEWQEQLTQAGKNLVVLEVQSEAVCETGVFDLDNVEYQFESEARAANEAAMARCNQVKHTFQRIARECADATFVQHTVDDEPTPESSELCEQLDIQVLPTLQFWREGRKLWEHKGALHMETGVAEGVLFYEGSAANGVKVTDFVGSIKSREQFDKFVNGGDPNVLKVVFVATSGASPCIRVYPAVLALSKNFVGYASFARMMDEGGELITMLQELNVIEVPTFLFYREGKEVGRHVGSSRADLIGQILTMQNSLGIAPPPPPTPAGATRVSRPVPQRVAPPRRNAWR
ncbi:hypothetical protein FOA52_012526 [Chlamydomonas sp. UWO 241]|nr:hypothetical protein FOA52_012526 [Chlamydomonas sp. UWO 241]